MPKTARPMHRVLKGTGLVHWLYELSVPLEHPVQGEVTYVVVSASQGFDRRDPTRCETAIFPANKQGEITSWSDLATLNGTLDHAAALHEVGYTVLDYRNAYTTPESIRAHAYAETRGLDTSNPEQLDQARSELDAMTGQELGAYTDELRWQAVTTNDPALLATAVTIDEPDLAIPDPATAEVEQEPIATHEQSHHPAKQ